VFVSNTAHDQPWQVEAKSQETGGDVSMETKPDVDLKAGKGIAGWVLRVDGRLLDVSACAEFADGSLATLASTRHVESSPHSSARPSSSLTIVKRRPSPRATL
jgi:hypothetical protein